MITCYNKRCTITILTKTKISAKEMSITSKHKSKWVTLTFFFNFQIGTSYHYFWINLKHNVYTSTTVDLIIHSVVGVMSTDMLKKIIEIRINEPNWIKISYVKGCFDLKVYSLEQIADPVHSFLFNFSSSVIHIIMTSI